MKSSQSGSLPNFSPGYHRSREAKGEIQHPYYTPPSPSFLHSFQSWSHCKSKLFFLWGFSTFCIVGSCVGSAPGCQLQLSLSPSNGFWWQALKCRQPLHLLPFRHELLIPTKPKPRAPSVPSLLPLNM